MLIRRVACAARRTAVPTIQLLPGAAHPTITAGMSGRLVLRGGSLGVTAGMSGRLVLRGGSLTVRAQIPGAIRLRPVPTNRLVLHAARRTAGTKVRRIPRRARPPMMAVTPMHLILHAVSLTGTAQIRGTPDVVRPRPVMTNRLALHAARRTAAMVQVTPDAAHPTMTVPGRPAFRPRRRPLPVTVTRTTAVPRAAAVTRSTAPISRSFRATSTSSSRR